MSLGFFGIQFGFALQNGNASRILGTFGAEVEHLSLFWLAAPLTGMIIQPIIGHYSDHTWTSLGRRRPYFLSGAILASIALMFMPNADILVSILPPLYVGAGILMIMDASFNVAMEPFRALVADLLPSDQRTLGFSIQTILIGLGAVIGSWLPYIFAEFFGVAKMSVAGEVPFNVTLSFYIGAIVFLVTIIWTVVTTKEYPPEKYSQDKAPGKGLAEIFTDFMTMPKTMRQLGFVQFFSWFALFSMWVFTTPAIAAHIYHVPPCRQHFRDVSRRSQLGWNNFRCVQRCVCYFHLFFQQLQKKVGRKMTHDVIADCRWYWSYIHLFHSRSLATYCFP